MTLHYITAAFRSLKMNKVYSVLSIGGFAVGFSICTIVGIYAYQELTVDQGFEDSERIYRIVDTKRQSTSLFSSFTSSLKEQTPEIEEACSYTCIRSIYPHTYKTNHSEVTKDDACTYTNSNFFKLFSLDVLHREGEELFIDENSVVLSESFSKALFGDNNPVGQFIEDSFRGDISKTLRVSAVVEDQPRNTSMPADYYLSQEYHHSSTHIIRATRKKKSGSHSTGSDVKEESFYPMGSLVKVIEGASLVDLEHKLNAIKNPPSGGDSLKLQTLHDIYLHSNEMTDTGAKNYKNNEKLIYLLLTIAMLILILSVINFINYSTARYLVKAKTTAIKKANGASKRQIVLYAITESCLSIGISILLSILFTCFLWSYAETLLGRTIDLGILYTSQAIILLVIVLLLILMLNTIIPLWGIFRFDLVNDINVAFSKRRGKINLLSIFQFTIAISLLISLSAINKQLYFMKNVDIGFDKENIVYTALDDCKGEKSAIKGEFDKLSFVTQSSLSTGLPINIHSTSTQLIETHDGQKKRFTVGILQIDDSFLDVYGIEILKGKGFEINTKGAICMINQAVLEELELESIKEANSTKYFRGEEVIGVVEDFHFASYHNKIEPLLIRFVKPDKSRVLSLKLLPGNFAEQKKQMQEVWKSFSPDDPLELRFIDAALEAMYKQEEQLSKAITSLCLIAFLLVTLGILGQVFQITLNKTKEIAIRKVNGAHLFDIFKIINGRFVIWVAIGFILAVPLAYYALGRWLENFAYKTSLSWWVFALAGLFTLLFVIGIVTLQSWKTANRNPVESLRHE